MTIHIAGCVMLILVVLLQAGRGAGLAVFGGGGGDSLFTTPSTTGFMKKFTAGLAAAFAGTSLLLALLSTRSSLRSVTSRALPEQAAESAPAAPQQQGGGTPAQGGGTPAQPKAPAAPAKK